MPSVEERLRYWRTRAQRMQVALEDISTDTVQGPLDDEIGLITRMQDVAKGVLGDDPSEFDQLRAKIERLTKALEQIANVMPSVPNERFRFFALATADAALSSSSTSREGESRG